MMLMSSIHLVPVDWIHTQYTKFHVVCVVLLRAEGVCVYNMQLVCAMLQCRVKTLKKQYLVGPDKLYGDPWTTLFQAYRISREYAQACLAHHRFIYAGCTRTLVVQLFRTNPHIISYVVPATPRVINWARPLIQTTCTLVHLIYM